MQLVKNGPGRASYSMLEDAANSSLTLGGGLTAAALTKAITDRTAGGQAINKFVSQHGANLRYAPGYLLDQYFLGGRGTSMTKLPNLQKGKTAVTALSKLMANPKARGITALLGVTGYGGAAAGNQIFHNYADA